MRDTATDNYIEACKIVENSDEGDMLDAPITVKESQRSPKLNIQLSIHNMKMGLFGKN